MGKAWVRRDSGIEEIQTILLHFLCCHSPKYVFICIYIYIYTLSCQCNYKELVKKIHFLEFWNIMRNSRVKTKPKSQAFGFLVSYIPLCLIWGLDIAAK